MGISYKPLWKLLIDKDMSKTQLREIARISPPTLAKMGKGEYVALEVLEKICIALECQLSDIVEVVSEEENKKE